MIHSIRVAVLPDNLAIIINAMGIGRYSPGVIQEVIGRAAQGKAMNTTIRVCVPPDNSTRIINAVDIDGQSAGISQGVSVPDNRAPIINAIGPGGAA